VIKLHVSQVKQQGNRTVCAENYVLNFCILNTNHADFRHYQGSLIYDSDFERGKSRFHIVPSRLFIKMSNENLHHPSMALQPFVGPWPLLQFRYLFYTDGMTPWTGDQPLAKTLPTHRHSRLEWDSNPQSQCSSGRRWFMSQTARPLRSSVYVIYANKIRFVPHDSSLERQMKTYAI
jgi:hypothetical protein